MRCLDTVEEVIVNQYKKYVDDNKKEPLYFVVHPNDWSDFIRRSQTYNSDPFYAKIQGVTVLSHPDVPVGQSKFVG